MLRRNNFFILIIFSFLYLSNIFSIVSFTLLDSKKGKVLLLGDCHNQKFDNISKGHIDLLLNVANFVHSFGKGLLINCVYETSRDAFCKYEALAKENKDDCELKGSISFIAINKFRVENPNSDNFCFIESDPRNKLIAIKICKMFDNILNLFSALIDKKVKHYKKNRFYKKLKANLLEHFENLSAEAYFKDLDQLNFFSAEIVNKYSGSEWLDEFKKIYEIFLNNIEIVKNIIKEKTVIFSLINYIEENSANSTQAKDLVINLQNIFLNKLNFLPVDIGFLDKILESQLKGAQAILVSGDLHAQTVSNILQSRGYEVLEHKSLATYLIDSVSVKKPDSNFNENYYKSILALLPEDLSAEIQSLISLINNLMTQKSANKLICKEPNKCLYCNISSSEKKLLYCSKCREATYCCKECQTMHWPLHKNVCKKSS